MSIISTRGSVHILNATLHILGCDWHWRIETTLREQGYPGAELAYRWKLLLGAVWNVGWLESHLTAETLPISSETGTARPSLFSSKKTISILACVSWTARNLAIIVHRNKTPRGKGRSGS